VTEETVTIDKLVHRGFGLGRLSDGKAVFVPYTIPGETVRVRITGEKKSYAHGELIDIPIPSPLRRTPPCPYFGKCGGCHLMHMTHESQLHFKKLIMEEVWRRSHPVIIGSRHSRELEYRRRVTLHVLPGNKGFGFMEKKSNKIVNIHDCLLCVPGIRDIFPWLRQTFLEKMSEWGVNVKQITVIIGSSPPPIFRIHTQRRLRRSEEQRIQSWSEVPMSFGPSEHDAPSANLDIGGLQLEIGTDSFFQAHPSAVEEILGHEAMSLPADTRLLELFAGMGLFTMAFAKQVSEVTAVESNPGSEPLFHRNLNLNAVQNARLHIATVEQWLQRNSEKLGLYTALFLDPTRSGLSRQARKVLQQGHFGHILYLSCDIATQYRDIQMWLQTEKYRVESLIFFDLFPNTFHLESLARFHVIH